MLLQGLFVPLTCPFYRDGASYLRKLEHNVTRYSLSPAAGMLALPPDGEAAALTDVEVSRFLHTVGEAAKQEKVLLAGVERSSISAVLAMAAEAADAGFDAVVLAPPPDWARLFRGKDASELLTFYNVSADRSPLPIVLWSNARPPSLALPAELVERLAQHPNVLGLADGDMTVDRAMDVRRRTEGVRREVAVTTVFEAVTGRMLRPTAAQAGGSSNFVAAETLSLAGNSQSGAVAIEPSTAQVKTRSRTVGFQLLSAGPAHAMVPLLQAGVGAVLPTMAACAPQACFEAYAAWKDGDQALAEERATRLRPAEEVLQRMGPAGVKAGCDFNGYFGGVPRLPRLPLTAEDRVIVEEKLRLIRN